LQFYYKIGQVAETGKNILRARQILQQEDLVAIPTETVYGLAGKACSEEAVVKIFDVKNRPSFDPLIVHVASLKQVEEIVVHIPEDAARLAEAFWPGPLTILLEKRNVIPDIVTSGLSTVAVRIPNHPLTIELLRSLSFPLAAPSANPFGYVSPTSVKHVDDQLGQKIPYILDGGDCPVGIESTIIGFKEDPPEIYRLGGITVEEIETIIGQVVVRKHSSSRPSAPGSFESHYAPGKKVLLDDISSLESSVDLSKAGLIRFKSSYPGVSTERQVILSESGNLKEAAKNLFSALRTLDKMEIQDVIAELVPEVGLGRAINDRLRRAGSWE
jgi:L-threonylcarbamoyladenylate synthase